MSNKNLTWNELEAEIFTPEEIAESRARVEIIASIIDARQAKGLSQKELAEISGVPLLTLQQYEQRQKNINKAQAEYLDMLSNALNCSIEQLIERI